MFEQQFDGNAPHLIERLTHCCQLWMCHFGLGNIIETKQRDVFRDT